MSFHISFINEKIVPLQIIVFAFKLIEVIL